MSDRLIIRNTFVLSMDPVVGDQAGADILVEDGRIVEIARGLHADGPELDATGTVAIPGFVDTHRHLWNTTLKGFLPNCIVADYAEKVLGGVGLTVRPEDAYAGNLLGALDALNAGVTSILDWSHCNNGPEHTDRRIAALHESGIRGLFAHGWPAGYEWFSHDDPKPHPGDEVRRLRAGVFSSDDQLLGLALAARGPGLSPDEVVEADWALARELDIIVSIHCGARWPGALLSPVRDLARLGLLGPDVNYSHLNETSADELALIADSGGSASISPLIELMMCHGLPATGRLLNAGIRPTLSVDAVTNVPGDMFGQMRVALAYERSRALPEDASTIYRPELTARDVLEFATIDGARALRLDSKVGSLRPGKQADIVLIRADDIGTMPLNDPIATVVTQADASNVDSVFVAGRAVKRGGKLLGVDVERIRRLAEDARYRMLEDIGAVPSWMAQIPVANVS
jgi:cytosine/adenosine deaminase-related metal-dependent hydrolase